MTRGNKKINIIFPLVLAVFLVGGMLIGNQLSRITLQESFLVYPKTNKISGIIDYIEKEYVDSVSRDELVEKTIPEILKHLDPHSVYIPAEDIQEYNEPLEGNFSGIGVQFNMQNDTVAIVNTIPNGPSEKVGILAGDRIIRVNDSLIAGINMNNTDVVKMLKGRKGTKVTVTIVRRGIPEPLKFEITRDRIPLYSVDIAYMVTDEIGYLKISKFSKTTYDEFNQSVSALLEQGMKKLILDLRNNGGGYMDAATNIADHFLEKDKLIVYTKGRSQPRKDVLATSRGDLLNTDVIVLIDEWSASASEILAGAIQDNDRGLIIGRRSFGKGLVQQQTVFSDGSALRLTIARYFTPTGRCIQKPYENGLDEYFQDLQNRYDRGEFIDADSIEFADSLKYKTPGGNTVYGGGGIMPDIFIPLDTLGQSEFLYQATGRGLIYRYAFSYTDNNRSALSNLDSYREIEEFLARQDLLSDFVDFAKQNGVMPDTRDISVSGKIITTQLKAYIARNIIDNEGYYPIIHSIDKTLQKSVEILSREGLASFLEMN